VPERHLLGAADPRVGRVRLTRSLPADRRTVWTALTDPERLAAWLGRLDGSLDRLGSRVRIWHEESVRSGHTVLEWSPQQSLALTWEFPDEPDSTVRFELSAGSPTNVTVTHEGLTEPAEYAAGWHRHLDYLEAHLAGADLPWADYWTGYDDLVARHRR